MSEQEQSTHQRTLDTYASLVRRTAHFTGVAGRVALRPIVWGLELPRVLKPLSVDRLRAERPLSEATLALVAIKRGQKEDDQQLVIEGESILTMAVEATALDPVPEAVAAQVIAIADAVELDPGGTLVNPLAAQHAKQVLHDSRLNHS